MRPVNAKRALLFAASIALALVAASLLVGAALSAVLDGMSKNLDKGPRHLIYHTDHTPILRACQDVIMDPQAAGLHSSGNGHHSVEGSQGGGKPPTSLPAVLRDLNFETMIVFDDSRAIIMFGSGFGHWGYRTFAAQGGTQ